VYKNSLEFRRKEDQNDEIMQFVEFWMKRTGRLPAKPDIT
jgi:hypothetical protein